jgi:hypothetical protein
MPFREHWWRCGGPSYLARGGTLRYLNAVSTAGVTITASGPSRSARRCAPTTLAPVRVNLRDGPHRRFWLLLERPDAEVCAQPPGFDEDVVVETTRQWLTRWFVGEIPLDDRITVRGPRPLVRMFASWGGLGRIEAQAA